MNILIVVGARPNFMKAAPLIAAIKQHNQRQSNFPAERQPWPLEPVQHLLVHTGQHYDERMSDAFFRDLDLPAPDVHLEVGSGSHAVQTAEVMRKFEPVLLAEKPDVVVVVGDVNSTVACALVTSKVAFDSAGTRPLIAHVEAGLRSFDRSMPEEVNRLVTDQVSDLLFVTEESAIQNLRDEGVPPHKIHFVGNTMIDSVLAFRQKAEGSTILRRLRLAPEPSITLLGAEEEGAASAAPVRNLARPHRPYGLLTLHRPSNVDNQSTIGEIMEGLEELASTQPIIFPVHPRTRQRLEGFGAFHSMIHRQSLASDAPLPSMPQSGMVLTEPLGYLDFLNLMRNARIVVTDSGGVQEETTCLGVPCVTVRNNTERPVTIEKGTNLLAGTRSERIRNAIRQQLARKFGATRLPEKWDGQAASRIVATLVQLQGQTEERLAARAAV